MRLRPGVRGDADFSEDWAYRYRLRRWWTVTHSPGQVRWLPVVMLNPSTADAQEDDRTIRRCQDFARAWGFTGIAVWNLYALRSTDPAGLWEVEDPVGPENDHRIRNMLHWADSAGWPVLAGWGTNAKPDREAWLAGLDGAANLKCLGKTKSGAPRHPLYVKGDTRLEDWP